MYKDIQIKFWEGFTNGNKEVIDTFRYIYYKFKKGIYIRIINNKLDIFLPFSNVKFKNEWGHKILCDPKYDNIYIFMEYISKMEKRRFNKKYVNKYINTWYGNNYLVRYEYPVKENETNISVIKNMFEELCQKRKVPDIEFFINKRDFPLLTKNKCEPYNHIWDCKNYPLVSHKYDKYTPILSMSSSIREADILFPTTEDWVRVQNKENKWFLNNYREYNDIFLTKWEDKYKTAVFRGSSTGDGVTIDKNTRLKISYLSKITPDEDGIKVLDAGITNWNVRPRKFEGEKYLQTIDIESLGIEIVKKMSPVEQSKYKYIVHISGHVAAYRLSLELGMGSVILLVESKWNIWYTYLLKKYVHYIPIKEDLSDLIETILWCRKNDDKCLEIATNAKKFYDKYLNKESILDYLQKIMYDLKKN